MNPFENPKNIIERESLENEEKKDSQESAKTFKEKIFEIKDSLNGLRESEQKLSREIDYLLDNLDNLNNYGENVANLSQFQDDLTSLQLSIGKKLDDLKNLNSANNELVDFSKIETKN